MNLWNFLSTVFSVVGSLAVVAVTYYKSKKLKFFESFFNKKTDAYEEFIKAVMFVNTIDIESLRRSAEASAIAVLYCSSEMKLEVKTFSMLCSDLTKVTIQGDEKLKSALLEQFKDRKSEIIDSMRNDLKRCTKFKFD